MKAIGNLKKAVYHGPMRILVIQSGKLGDMVCTTPVFRAIKKEYPDTFLAVAGDKVNKLVLKGNPNIDEYIEFNSLTRDVLKERKLDVAILLTPNPSLLLDLLLCRIPKIIAPKIIGGFSPYQTKIYRLLSLFVTRAQHRMGNYAPREYLRMLESIGIYTEDTRKELYLDSDTDRKVEGTLSVYKHKVVIAPAAGNKIKEWPPENFGKVASYLMEKYGSTIIIVAVGKDKELVDKMKSQIKGGAVIDTTGKLSIEELKAYIKHSHLFISADTGPIYIAEAFDIPTIDIIGPIDEREQPPRGEKHINVLPQSRRKPELFVMNARVYDYEEALRLSQSTKVDDVIKSAEQLIKNE
jgi:ADP-heptose:LPS heptosyltransferase